MRCAHGDAFSKIPSNTQNQYTEYTIVTYSIHALNLQCVFQSSVLQGNISFLEILICYYLKNICIRKKLLCNAKVLLMDVVCGTFNTSKATVSSCSSYQLTQASFTKQDKLVHDQNSIKVLTRAESSVVDLLMKSKF